LGTIIIIKIKAKDNDMEQFQTILKDINNVLNVKSDTEKAKDIAKEIGRLDDEEFGDLVRSPLEGQWPTSGFGTPDKLSPKLDNSKEIKVGSIPSLTGISRGVGDEGFKRHDGQEGVREVIDILSNALTRHPGWNETNILK